MKPLISSSAFRSLLRSVTYSDPIARRVQTRPLVTAGARHRLLDLRRRCLRPLRPNRAPADRDPAIGE